MISTLVGKLCDITPPHIVLEVQGIGYELDLPLSHIPQLPQVGAEKVHLYTHLIIREDAHNLYGFIDKSERDCFRQLIRVSGIGAKIALALLSTMTSQQIQVALDNADVNTLALTPGIGKKMAERIILELKGKLLYNTEFIVDKNAFNSSTTTYQTSSSAILTQDLTNALASLGYNSREISTALREIGEITDLSSGIKQALQRLSKF